MIFLMSAAYLRVLSSQQFAGPLPLPFLTAAGSRPASAGTEGDRFPVRSSEDQSAQDDQEELWRSSGPDPAAEQKDP